MTRWRFRCSCLLLFLLVAAFGGASGVEIAFRLDGNLWQTLKPKEKAILAEGIIDGILVSSYAEAARLGPESGSEVFSRTAITRDLAQIVLRLDAFYAEPENRECNVGVAIMIKECAGGDEIARDIENLNEEDW